MRSDLEARLLATLRSASDFAKLHEIGLTRDSFEHYGSLYDHISKMVEATGRVPRLLDLKQTFNLPDVVTRSAAEFDDLIGEAGRFQMVRGIQELIDENVRDHGNNPPELIEGLVRDLSNLGPTSESQLSITDSSMMERMAKYEAWSRDPTKKGIPTGMSFFDETVKLGWLPGEVVGLVGRTYVGKSWLLMFFGQVAWQAGKRILFVSPEMSVEETEARFDGMLMAKNDILVEVTDLYRGYIPNEKMKDLAKKVATKKSWVTYSSSEEGRFGLATLGRLVRHHKPDMLIVDGLPLLEAEGGKRQQVWESIKELSYGLKHLAVRQNIVILISHQAPRRAHNIARPPGLHEISLGDAFAQACDRVLALSRPEHEEEILRITVQKFRKGQPHAAGVDFTFIPKRGEIHEYVPRDAGRAGDADTKGNGKRAGDAVSLP